jgi:RNA polymerase sigma-70 factor (ECF subfamily)
MGVADGDDELMFRFQRDHDYQAFEELFGRHKDVLLRFLARLLGDIATAHDASQQTWLKVIEVARRQDYLAQPDARFRTWLLTLARNHAIDEYQRKFAASRTIALTDEIRERSLNGPIAGQQAPADPLDDANREQIAGRLAAAIQALPLEQREVIALWIAEVEPAAIAEITGAPRDTVLSRKKYALAKLRSALSDLLMEGDHVRRSS